MNKGGRPKGLPKTGGRKPGTPNKIGAAPREYVAELISENKERLREALKEIDNPKDFCNIMLGLMQFVLPKMASIEYKDKDKPKTLADELDEISGEQSR